MERIEQILKKYGPMLSGKLSLLLEAEYKISNEAARQAISRAKSPVQKIKVLPFNKNQIFCYLEEQYKSSQYRKSLYDALKTDSASVSAIIHALENNYCIMKKDLLPIYSKSPIENTKGHRKFDEIIDKLLNQGIVFEADEDYYAISRMYSNKEYNITYAKSKELIVKMAADDFVSWAGKLNLGAYNSFKIFPKEANFAHFKWTATMPSYITPLFDEKEKQPGFVVVDAIISSNVTIKDVSYFVEKVKIIRNFRRVPRFAPVLLVNVLEKEALQYLKDNKIIVGVLSNIFDKKYTEIIMSIYYVLRNATAVIMKEPQKLENLIQEIDKSEGRFNNAMGDLFECMVGLFFSRMGCRYLELNKQVPNGRGGKYEMDVLLERDNKILVIECKAYRGKLDKEYVEKWLSLRIPAFRKFLEEIYPGRRIEFELWALGGFEHEAENLLKKHQSSAKKYDLHFLDKKQIYYFAKKYGDKTFCKQIDKHFSEYGNEVDIIEMNC